MVPPRNAAERRFTYDTETAEFVAGTPFYDESLISFLAFLTVVRGIEDHLGLDGFGSAIAHDHVFDPGEDEATVAALALGPGRPSRLLVGDERRDAVTSFQAIVDVMLADREKLPPPVDHLDDLR